MIIGIGSENKVKIKACREALEAVLKVFPQEQDNQPVFHNIATRTSVPSMPLNTNDLMQGARERALFAYNELKRRSITADYCIGLEGGVYRPDIRFDESNHAFLNNWVYVWDGNKGYFGSSGSLPVPFKIIEELFDKKRELAAVIDEISGKQDVRSHNGAFGILTRDLITRSDSFITAVINAIVPFFNREYQKQEG